MGGTHAGRKNLPPVACYEAHTGTLHLAITSLVPQLQDCFGKMRQLTKMIGRQQAAAGVDR